MTDIDTTKPDWYLLAIIFLNGARLIFQLHTLKKQIKNGTITRENLEISLPVRTLVLLDRYVSEFLEKLRRKY